MYLIPPPKGCLKVSYKSKKEANRIANGMKKNARVSARTELRPYFCRACKAWHLTHMSVKQYVNSLK